MTDLINVNMSFLGPWTIKKKERELGERERDRDREREIFSSVDM